MMVVMMTMMTMMVMEDDADVDDDG